MSLNSFSIYFTTIKFFFLFDDIENYICFAKNVFLAEKMKFNIGEKQTQMRSIFNNGLPKTEPIVFSKKNHNFLLQSKLNVLKPTQTQRDVSRN